MALWAKWTGEGLTAGTIPDQSGNGRDLTNYGLTAATPGPFSSGFDELDCDGASTANRTASAGFPSNQPLTVCLRLRCDSDANEYQIPISGYTSTSPLQVLITDYGANCTLRLRGVTHSFSFSIDTVYAIVLVCASNGYVDMYINDLETPVVSGGTPMGTVPQDFEVGSWQGYNPFTGVVGDISIYDHVLDQSEREAWAAESAGEETPAQVVAAPSGSGQYFRLTLTGDADATTDYILPPSNISARLRSGSPSYLQATIPYTDDYATAISDRPNGDLLLQHVLLESAGSETLTDICTVDFETVQPSLSVNSKSLVLVGHRQTTNSSPGSHTVSALSLQTGSFSYVAIVPGFDPAILPADDITAEDATFTVGLVQLQASVSSVGRWSVQTTYVEES